MGLTIAVTGLNRGENPQPGASIIRSLRREFDDVTIVGMVYEILESGIYAEGYADVIYQLPTPSQGTALFLERLDYICQSYPIDILIPTLDAEMDGMLRIEKELTDRGIKMMLPEMDSYASSKKKSLSKIVEKAGCKTPRTLQAVETKGLMMAADVIGFPLMLKGPFYGADKVHTREALVDHFHKIITSWGGPVVLQEFVQGDEYNVVAVGDGTGDISGYFSIRKTVLSEKGKGFGGISIRDNKLDEIAQRLIKHLKWKGPLELEFIKNKLTQEYLLIEINPRFPAWIDFPSQLGHNLPALVVNTLLNNAPAKLEEFEVGKFFIRHSIDLVGDLSQLEQLSTLGELLCDKSMETQSTNRPEIENLYNKEETNLVPNNSNS